MCWLYGGLYTERKAISEEGLVALPVRTRSARVGNVDISEPPAEKVEYVTQFSV